VLFFVCMVPLFAFPKVDNTDYTWWNEIHGWKPGMPGWRNWMIISPGYLGPNALPVPEVKKGIVPAGASFEFGTSIHFMPGDPTQDIFVKYYRSFADNRIAFELYDVVIEHYAMSTTIRDERIARDYDGKGYATGDLYFSTLIQLIKDRKFPDTMLRMACRTASGGPLEAARYSDSPGYFFDFSFSKKYYRSDEKLTILPFASAGFYSWQTNDELNLQNDAYMYAFGTDLKWLKWSVCNSLSGYSGYKNLHDKPVVYTFDLNRSLMKNTIRLQYLHGFRDWNYDTIRLSYIINFKGSRN